MKRLILLFATATNLISCTSVKFETSQPEGATSLSQFPPEIIGLYTSGEQDTLRILTNSFSYSDGKEIDINAELSASTAVLKKVNKHYILSLKDNGSWDVFPLKVSRNGLTVFYADLDGRTEQVLNVGDSVAVKEIRTDDDQFDHYLVNPSPKEFKRLLRKKLFSEMVKFQRLDNL